MKKYKTITSIISLSKTMTADNAEPVTLFDIPFYEANFHCYDNALYYGDGSIMATYMNVGDVLTYKNGNLRDMFIKNKTAGSNGTISITATVPTAFTREALK